MNYREEVELFKTRKKQLNKIIKRIRLETDEISFKLMMGDTQMCDNLFVISVSPTYKNDQYLKQSRIDINTIVADAEFKEFCDDNNVIKEFKKKKSQVYSRELQRHVYEEIYRCIFRMDM